MTMEEYIHLFDSTLDEGERSPGCSLTPEEKLRMAHQLERLRPDIIEAGSPLDGPSEFEAVRLIAKTVEACGVAARCRPTRQDIDRSWEAIQFSKKPRLHVVISAQAREGDEWLPVVKYARSLCSNIQVSFSDAPGCPAESLIRHVAAAIDAGATVIGLPDTMGYAMPEEYGAMFRTVLEKVPSSKSVVLSARCRNDLGMAVANTLSALQNGARQAECTVNGIGMRAGIAALEEVAMAIRVHTKKFGWNTGIQGTEIYKCSQLLSSFTGMPVPRNKPIVGANVFAQQQPDRGSDQANPLSYEPVTAESVGIKHSTIVLGKHSGKLVLLQRYKELGFDLTNEELDRVFQLFTQLAEQKKEIYDDDLIAIRENDWENAEELYHLEKLQVHSGTTLVPTATIELRKGDQRFVDSATGDGPVDAALKAIERITGVAGQLSEYLLKSVSLGRDGFGEVFVRVDFQGAQFHGRGVSTDVIAGSAKAYLEALNRALSARNRKVGDRKEGTQDMAVGG
jgi:2-isopropylmalate synthase